MWGILVSFLWTGVGWVFRAIVVKFGFYTALFLFVSEGIPFLVSSLGLNFSAVGAAFDNISPLASYFMGLVRLDIGIPMLISAHATAFTIRRLPVIG